MSPSKTNAWSSTRDRKSDLGNFMVLQQSPAVRHNSISAPPIVDPGLQRAPAPRPFRGACVNQCALPLPPPFLPRSRPLLSTDVHNTDQDVGVLHDELLANAVLGVFQAGRVGVVSIVLPTLPSAAARRPGVPTGGAPKALPPCVGRGGGGKRRDDV